MKQRIEFVDLAKGICISLVVLLHVYGDLSGTVIKIMNLFRMPLYFVLSGLFFKTYEGLYPFLKKKTNKLIIPFLFTFFFVIIPVDVLLHFQSGTDITLNSLFWGGSGKVNLGVNGAAWFLLCLFFVNFYFYLIFLLTHHNILGITILSCLCGFLGYGLNYYHIVLPMWLDSSLTAMPFFLMGYTLRCYSNILYGEMTSRNYASCALSLIVLICVYLIDEWNGKSTIAYGNNEFDINVVSLYLGGFAGTYFVLMVSKYLQHVPGVSYIGRYSIVVLLTHLLYLFVFRNVMYQLGIPQESIMLNLFVFIVIMLLELPTIKFCIKYLPYCFAQKDLWK